MVSFSCVSYWTYGVLAYANSRLLGNAAKADYDLRRGVEMC
jgi:hypothetical protein